MSWPLLNTLANSVLLNHNDRSKYKCHDFTMFLGSCHITITILYSLPGDTLKDLEAFNLIWLALHKQLELCQELRPDYVNKMVSSTGELRLGVQELWEPPWISFICCKRQFHIKTNFESFQRKSFPIGTRPSWQFSLVTVSLVVSPQDISCLALVVQFQDRAKGQLTLHMSHFCNIGGAAVLHPII